jgi:hypothetical protein
MSTRLSESGIATTNADPSDSTPRRRVGLIILLVLAIGMGVLFFRSQGSFDRTLGALVGAESLSVIAIIVVLTLGVGDRRVLGAALAFLAAMVPTFEGVAFATFAGGAPRMAGSASAALQTASLLGMFAVNLAVMICATLYARGNRLMLVLYVVVGLVAGTTILRIVFR